MDKRKTALIAVVLGVVVVLGIGLAAAQEERGRGRRGRFDPEQMRQWMMDNIKESLGSTDEEWTLLQPKLEKVMALSREVSDGGRMRMGFRDRGRGGPGRGGPGGGTGEEAAADAPPPSEVAVATEALRTTLDTEGASTEEIKAKLTALRAAREKAKQELAKEQEGLRLLLTLRQEAELVLMGTLD
ncbi:MAG: hypothetical protein ACYTAN_02055 [Planctomycetota bacterium]|jgi:hypothetical protein